MTCVRFATLSDNAGALIKSPCTLQLFSSMQCLHFYCDTTVVHAESAPSTYATELL